MEAFERRVTRKRFGVAAALALGLAVGSPERALGQELPQGPSMAPRQAQAGTMDGTVVDGDGDLVSGATVTLATAGSAEIQQTVTGTNGQFHFGGLPPGRFKVSASADGMTLGVFLGELSTGQRFVTPPVRLGLEGVASTVQVVASREELAEAEVKVELHQRVAGVLPNFYVTYDWHAAPLTNKQKFELTWRNFLDPVNVAVDASIAGIQQANDTYPGYGSDAASYGKRFGADTGDFLFGSALAGYVFPAIFHQDPRYFYKGTGSFRARAYYAIAAAVICRGDNGRWQPNYSNVAGDFASGALSNLYYPAADRRGARLTVENSLLGIAYDALGNLVQEFAFKHITPHAPVYASTSRQPSAAQPEAVVNVR